MLQYVTQKIERTSKVCNDLYLILRYRVGTNRPRNWTTTPKKTKEAQIIANLFFNRNVHAKTPRYYYLIIDCAFVRSKTETPIMMTTTIIKKCTHLCRIGSNRCYDDPRRRRKEKIICPRRNEIYLVFALDYPPTSPTTEYHFPCQNAKCDCMLVSCVSPASQRH